MNKFYINDSNGRKYYAYKYERDEVKYISLERKNISLLLSSIAKDKIRNIHDKDKYMEIVFENGVTLIIDNLRIFKPHQDNDDKYFQILLTKLKSFVEKETLKKYKATLPPNHIPKVNRTRKKEIPKRRIIAGALSLALTASLIAGLINKEIAKAQESSPFENTTISYTIPSVENNKKEVNNETIIEPVKDNSIKVDLAFSDETANGKLEQTIELCAPYLDEWIERYGLPRDLTYALVSQEYGLLDCSINAGGACGPMQLQVSSFHNDNAIEYVTQVIEDAITFRTVTVRLDSLNSSLSRGEFDNARNELKESYDTLIATLQNFKQYVQGIDQGKDENRTEELALSDEIVQNVEKFYQEYEEHINLHEQGYFNGVDGATLHVEHSNSLRETADVIFGNASEDGLVFNLTTYAFDSMIESLNGTSTYSNQVSIFLVIISIIVIIFAFIQGLIISRGVRNPINNIVDAASEIVEGNIDIDIRTNTTDEMGMLSNSISDMTYTFKGILEDINILSEKIEKGDITYRIK